MLWPAAGAERADAGVLPRRGGPSHGARADGPAAAVDEVPGGASGDHVEALHRRLAQRLDEPVADLVLTENRSRILSVRRIRAGLAIRVHRCFAAAPDPVVERLAVLVGGRRGVARRRALAAVRAYHGERANASAAPPRRGALRPVGETLDLRVLRDELAAAYFDRPVDVAITWGRNGPRRRCRSIQLGSYDDRSRLIRIHPALDRPGTPRYVVASVVHHEMLHAVLPSIEKRGRRILHGRAFRTLERRFADFERAERWIAGNLDRLLRG